MLLEKYHTPLFDYSEEIKNLYKFIILEMKKKRQNKDFILSNKEFGKFSAEYYSLIINDFNSLGFNNIKLKNIKFIINIKNFTDDEFKEIYQKIVNKDIITSGSFGLNDMQEIINTEYDVNNEELEINLITYKNHIDIQEFSRIFSHEFNHIFSNYHILKNSKQNFIRNIHIGNAVKYTISRINNSNIFNDIEKDDLFLILKVLFDKDEMHAYANSINAEINHRLSKGKFKSSYRSYDDLNYTNVGNIYNEMYNAIYRINDYSSEKLFNICRYWNEYNENNEIYDKFSKYYENCLEDEFKRYFLKIAISRLIKFRKQIQKIADNYIEMNEFYCKYFLRGIKSGFEYKRITPLMEGKLF